ncbi:MAG: hypothetical protein WDA16_05890 [Candidatus Thermoplasmatota archaeon]
MTPPSEVEPGPGESLVAADEIDTSNVHLEDESASTSAPARRENRLTIDEKEAINQEIIKALRENLANPIFPVLIVRIFNLGGALYDSGLDADMPPLHRLLIGSVVLVVIIGATNPDVMEKIAAKWKKVAKPKASPSQPEVRPDATA